ncbi:hypothetical protein PF001_g9807 [Phytophthora fragariae]|uniref:Uncharacterized protein n=1 Tax=Phytophthora fragariae TaxID=53985 RepID=A0A6A4DMX5_9STRA|nr:hypothetical protein PF011_g17871 [Phytophthora fragariae]KAE9311285.1 hypothetical protein PF001_g9807 [Phytophthora fragariae]
MRAHMHELEMEGNIVVAVCVENKLAGVIAVIARPQMGTNHVKAVALPGEKASQIKALQSHDWMKPRVVCMVGRSSNI